MESVHGLSTVPLAKRALLVYMASFCLSGFCVQCLGFLLVLLTKALWSQLQIQWCRGGVSLSCLSPCACGARTFSLCLLPARGAVRSVSVCCQHGVPSVQSLSVARTGCHPFSLCLLPARGAIRSVSVCVARRECHTFRLYQFVAYLLTAE